MYTVSLGNLCVKVMDDDGISVMEFWLCFSNVFLNSNIPIGIMILEMDPMSFKFYILNCLKKSDIIMFLSIVSIYF